LVVLLLVVLLLGVLLLGVGVPWALSS
jgi:hypothetical protein